ncbi:MAG: NYN domain-containing protein [Alphaproteobacteria bacterium]|nr:NYN domain-containing protein [Alphaproteobacteria bacterium]
MADEPAVKRAIAFFDGQNLYRHAKDAFGHHHPNYDPKKLFDAVCADKRWVNYGVRFYTGTPAHAHSPMWHDYWANRLLSMRRAGIIVESRPIRYRAHEVELADGTIETKYIPQEKGIDLRLGLDVVRLARVRQLDVAVIFSQDQDLAEVVNEVKEIARDTNRWIKVVSAFPTGPAATAQRGVNGAEWYPMDQAFYDACLDLRDYRPKISN